MDPRHEALERELRALIVEALNLTDVTPEAIDVDAPLLGVGEAAAGGLGLDSIDALELAMAIKRRWGVTTRSDDARNAQIFRSVRSLAAYVAERTAAAPGAGGAA